MKMDRISWNAIRRRLLVIAGPPAHLQSSAPVGFHARCHLASQSTSAASKRDGLPVPLIPPLQREIAGDAAETPHTRG